MRVNDVAPTVSRCCAAVAPRPIGRSNSVSDDLPVFHSEYPIHASCFFTARENRQKKKGVSQKILAKRDGNVVPAARGFYRIISIGDVKPSGWENDPRNYAPIIQGDLNQAHNGYLDTYFERGFVGLVCRRLQLDGGGLQNPCLVCFLHYRSGLSEV